MASRKQPAKRPAHRVVSKAESSEPLRLHLACGNERLEGFVNVDIRKSDATDKILDLHRIPWPWADNSVDEVSCKDYICTLPMPLRIAFMNELWRVMKPGAKAVIINPHFGHSWSVAHPSYVWPPVVEDWFYWFHREWREANGQDHMPITAHFDWGYGHILDGDWGARNQEAQAEGIRHYRNVARGLVVTLMKLE